MDHVTVVAAAIAAVATIVCALVTWSSQRERNRLEALDTVVQRLQARVEHLEGDLRRAEEDSDKYRNWARELEARWWGAIRYIDRLYGWVLSRLGPDAGIPEPPESVLGDRGTLDTDRSE